MPSSAESAVKVEPLLAELVLDGLNDRGFVVDNEQLHRAGSLWIVL
jgi:hypothetical protein